MSLNPTQKFYSAPLPASEIVRDTPPYKQVLKGVYSANQFPFSEGKDEGKQNLYKLFVEHSWNLCKNHGTATLIVSSSLMCDQSSTWTRKLLLDKTHLQHLIEFPKQASTTTVQVFTGVTQGTCIYQFTKVDSENSRILIAIGNDRSTLQNLKFEAISKQQIATLFHKLSCFPMMPIGATPIVERILTNPSIQVLKCSLVSEPQKGDLNLGTHKAKFGAHPTAVKLMRGTHVARFCIAYNSADEYVESGFRQDVVKENSDNRYLISQDITGQTDKRRLHFAIQDAGASVHLLWGDSVNKSLLKDQTDNALFLGILNSKFMDWFFRLTSSNNHVMGHQIEMLPIPPIPDDIAKSIKSTVEIITVRKRSGEATDDLEDQIDQLVYRLYGLSGAEISIVEAAYR